MLCETIDDADGNDWCCAQGLQEKETCLTKEQLFNSASDLHTLSNTTPRTTPRSLPFDR